MYARHGRVAQWSGPPRNVQRWPRSITRQETVGRASSIFTTSALRDHETKLTPARTLSLNQNMMPLTKGVKQTWLLITYAVCKLESGGQENWTPARLHATGSCDPECQLRLIDG